MLEIFPDINISKIFHNIEFYDKNCVNFNYFGRAVLN